MAHSHDDCIGAYRATDIAARSQLCLGCWTTHRPYVDESDEDEIERGDQPERHPNRLRWLWPGRLKELLDTAVRRERAAHAELGEGRTIGDERYEPRAGPGAQCRRSGEYTAIKAVVLPRAAGEYTEQDYNAAVPKGPDL